jgi:hypothetical protein
MKHVGINVGHLGENGVRERAKIQGVDMIGMVMLVRVRFLNAPTATI